MATTDPASGLVIADAGPLIHLDELGCLDLLSDFSRILIPDAVWREVATHRPLALTQAGLAVERMEPGLADSKVTALSLSLTLHRGETEALILATRYTSALFVTDDTAAKLAAQTLGLRVHGSLGIIVRALRRGLRSRDEVLALLGAIPGKSTLHIRPSLLEQVIAQVREAGL